MKLISMVGTGAVALGLLAGGTASAVDLRDVIYGGRGDNRSSQGHRSGVERGYQDGSEIGWKDAASGRFDLRRHQNQDGRKVYRRADGDRDDYVRGYRVGFEEGYENAFKEYQQGRRGGSRGYSRGRDRGRDDGYYGRDGGYYGRDGGYYGRDGRDVNDRGYDYQRDGRHRHEGLSRWCYERHDDRDYDYRD